ncbi:MAG: arginine decarboxylase, pyruvoyl-dependent [Parcubacteria group bacterium]|nr:arginine decarboxylase, pyruvoyl-dependent [Parcubacteria group bacterium]MBI4217187.1 arginine decarboxylase, pyruvoyl-dependent [Parcubacteria group bacterium]
MTPTKYFITKGVGIHKHKLNSFELALRDAGIQKFNLVTVSSILPPSCKKVTIQKGLEYLSPGEVVFCVMARNESNEPNRMITASVGLAIPKNSDSQYGYISEHHVFGETEDKAGEYAEDLAASMLASTLGMKFNIDDAWDTRRQAFLLSGKIVRTAHITQTARSNKDGLWTSVVAAVVFIPNSN